MGDLLFSKAKNISKKKTFNDSSFPFLYQNRDQKANYIKIVNLLLRKMFCGNLNEAISLAEIASFRFPWKIFLTMKLRFTISSIALVTG